MKIKILVIKIHSLCNFKSTKVTQAFYIYYRFNIYTRANVETSFNFTRTSTGTFQVKHIFRFNLLKYTFREVATQPNI